MEPLDEAQQAEVCSPMAASMDEVVTAYWPNLQHLHVECAMEQKSRRSRSLLAIIYEARLTVTTWASLAVSDKEALEAMIANEDLVVETISFADCCYSDFGLLGLIQRQTSACWASSSGSTVSSSASALAFGASFFFLGLAQQAQ